MSVSTQLAASYNSYNVVAVKRLLIFCYRESEDNVLDNPIQQKHLLVFSTIFMGYVIIGCCINI